MSARSDADVAAVRMMMDRLDLTVAELGDDTSAATSVPTFGDYIPVVRDSMPASRTRDHYQTYWTKILAQPGWADRALNEPTAVELQGLCELIKTQRLIRRNGRDGREVVRHVIDALRRVYKHAEDNRIIDLTGPRDLVHLTEIMGSGQHHSRNVGATPVANGYSFAKVVELQQLCFKPTRS